MSADRTPPDWAIRTAADRKALAAGCYWDHDQAGRIVRFAEKYTKDKFSGKRITLLTWQSRLLQSVYGWRNADGSRRIRLVILHVPKKNGKTLLVSILTAYELLAARVHMPLVVSASTVKDNAKQVYEQLAYTIEENKPFKAIADPLPNKYVMRLKDGRGEYRALSSDGPASEGLNCSLVVVDEAHAHRSPELWGTLRYATIGRPTGFLVVISTAGDDLTHWYYGLVKKARNVLSGVDTDTTTYAEVYEADPEVDDLESPDVWRRVNPSLDQPGYDGYTSERFAADLAAAKADPKDWIIFKRYRLNIFCRDEEAGWISLDDWDRCQSPIADAELLKYRCWLGLDGSQRIDPTSLGAVWLLPGRRFYVRSWSWVAEDGVLEREKSNLPTYRQFAEAGCMQITRGDMMEKAEIKARILGLLDAGHQVEKLVLDANLLWVFSTEIEAHGITVERFQNRAAAYADPIREFKTAVAERRILHDGNPWLRYCVNNVRLKLDDDGNGKPSKRRSVDKIDGAISVLFPFAAANPASADVPPDDSPPPAFAV